MVYKEKLHVENRNYERWWYDKVEELVEAVKVMEVREGPSKEGRIGGNVINSEMIKDFVENGKSLLKVKRFGLMGMWFGDDLIFEYVVFEVEDEDLERLEKLHGFLRNIEELTVVGQVVQCWWD